MKKVFAIIFCLQLVGLKLFSQTGGPGQPEFMQFKPVTATDLVNPLTGSFSYNIPLFEIGGYPCNLSYQSGIQMEDVASTVGLGWNINIGAITHSMRGLPDDYNGDIVVRKIYMKPNYTYGMNYNFGVEIAGFSTANLGVGVNLGKGVFYNNYNGWGVERSFGLNFSISNASKTNKASLGLGMKANSQSGVDLYAAPSVSRNFSNSDDMSAKGSLGGTISINSREGLKTSINVGMAISGKEKGENGKDKESGGHSFSGSYSFAKLSGIPKVSYPFTTNAFLGNIKVGGEISFFHPHGELKGYHTKQTLSTNVINTPAYGYLYSDKAPLTSSNVLHDFNREKDQPYINDVSINIGIPYYTGDVYSVNAQGISGSFQLNRGDIGVIFDNRIVSGSSSVNVGIEVGIGNAFKVGASISLTNVNSSCGKWYNGITNSIDFKPSAANNLYQSAYFKSASDVMVDENNLYSKLGKDNPVKVGLSEIGVYVNMENELLNDANQSYPMKNVNTNTNLLYKNIRDPRTINIQHLTATEADKAGLNKNIVEYSLNTFNCNRINTNNSGRFSRVNVYRKASHISEITATNNDGMRYVFGLPTYNVLQKEVSFTLGTSPPGTDGLVNYSGLIWGANGKDGFYESTTLPPYVTSNLLTAVLSPDFIDVDNNGPTVSDVGNYVKFNYAYAGIYKWRTPYGQNKATFNKAYLSDDADNKGSYVYGEKELWYIHSVESKTEIAEFYYDANFRQDGLGVNEEGLKNPNNKLYKLDSIKVYSINEREIKGNSAVPKRIIYFQYDYQLCKGTYNSAATSAINSGKLTLTKVSFTSGKSKKELRSPYLFTYGEQPSGTVFNPNYNPRNVNRWGHYQLNNNTSDVLTNFTNPSLRLSNIDFPYAQQDETEMNKNAYAWNLTKIKLPSGGNIKVIYEPHRYAYTQDKRNMEMVLIEGTSQNVPTSTASSNLLYAFNSNPNYYFKFKLKSPITGADAHEQFLYEYFNNNLNQFIYYKTLVKLTNTPVKWEWINGYFKIHSAGLIGNNHGYVQLEPVCVNDKDDCNDYVNPISKSAWQFMRMNRSDICYGTGSAPLMEPTLEDFLRTPDLDSKVNDQTDAFFKGFNKYARDVKYFANSIALNQSFIRLYSPGSNKIMGGSRVKTVVSSDNWGNLTNQPILNKDYTIDYDYTVVVKNPVNNQDKIISSGVVEYEPFNGGDENPLRTPVFYNQHIKMAPDNNLYVETPYNESLFPAVNLVYSKVKIINNKTTNDVPGTGHQEMEYYTAKDFPVQSSATLLGDNHEKKTSMLAGLAMSLMGMNYFFNYITLSQGFSIVLNDMHGKQKATKNFNSRGTLVSSKEFQYAISKENITIPFFGSSYTVPITTFNKNLKLINHNGVITNSDNLGISISAICDSRTTEHNTSGMGVDLNLDFVIYGIIPAFTFVPLPNMTIEETRINTVAFNKIITKKGILKNYIVTENGASISTENLLFDDKTGSVVLTKTTNEFNDTVFSFHYPANWIYKGMSAGYLSSDVELTFLSGNNSFTKSGDLCNVLKAGDEFVNTSNGNRFWITTKSVCTFTVKSRNIADQVNLLGTWKLIRPGRKNMLTEQAGTIVTLANPIQSNNSLSFSKVISTSMMEYGDARTKPCSCKSPLMYLNGKTYDNKMGNYTAFFQKYNFDNPFLTGEKGNWYSLRTWTYVTDRTRGLGLTPYQTNIRKDGVFTTFNNFWNPANSVYNDWNNATTGWQWLEKLNIKDINGLTLETKDVLNRHNSMLAGYKQKLIIAEAGNAMKREILYDGFEDWNYLPYSSSCDTTYLCEPELINWNGVFGNSNAESHTGKHSGELINPLTLIQVSLNDNDRDPNCNFRPFKTKKYIFSAWVRETGNPQAYSFPDPSVNIAGVSFHTSGNVIDGWQRIYGEFSIASSSTSLLIKFSKGNNPTYFDDIRIFPSEGKMITYVYDGNTQKLTYTCDENNYFTKYIYDSSDNLQSINKETEQGIQTIKEARSSTPKN